MNDHTESFSPEDIRVNRGPAVLCYIAFLFIIPLIIRRNSSYVKFHINQGINVCLLYAVIGVCKWLVNLIFGSFVFMPILIIINFVFSILTILCYAMMVLGIYYVVSGRAVELPIIGKIALLKL